MKITCAEFLRILKENPDKELVFENKKFKPDRTGIGFGYYVKNSIKFQEVQVKENKVTITIGE